MAYDFCLKKKFFGGLDPDSVTEYITKIKAENNLLKKELANRPEEADSAETEKLKDTVNDLNGTVSDYKNQVMLLNKKIAELELEIAMSNETTRASDSKIAVESLNIANHYFTQAVKMAGDVSDTTINKAEQSKDSLTASLASLDDFEQNIANFRKQINGMIDSLDDVSDNFERIKQFEGQQIDPVESASGAAEKKLGDMAPLSLVD